MTFQNKNGVIQLIREVITPSLSQPIRSTFLKHQTFSEFSMARLFVNWTWVMHFTALNTHHLLASSLLSGECQHRNISSKDVARACNNLLSILLHRRLRFVLPLHSNSYVKNSTTFMTQWQIFHQNGLSYMLMIYFYPLHHQHSSRDFTMFFTNYLNRSWR